MIHETLSSTEERKSDSIKLTRPNKKPPSDSRGPSILWKNSISKLKFNIKSKYGDKLKENSENSMKIRSTIWKTRSSIGSELNDFNCNPIAKRLYSLVNNSVSKYQLTPSLSYRNSVNNERMFEKSTILETDSLKGEESNQQNTCNVNDPSDMNHNKLRGFLKQISVERSGLLSNHKLNVVSKSMKSKFKRLDCKEEVKELRESSISRNIIDDNEYEEHNEDNKASSILTEDNKIPSKNNNNTPESIGNVIHFPTIDNSQKTNIIRVKDINVSNSSKIIRNTKSRNSSSVSSERTVQSISDGEDDIVNKDSVLHSYGKLFPKQKFKTSKDGFNKLNLYFNKFRSNKEKIKPNNNNSNNIKNQNCGNDSIKVNIQNSRDLPSVSSLNYKETPIPIIQKPLLFPNDGFDNSEFLTKRTNYKSNLMAGKTQVGSLNKVSDKGDEEPKSKVKLSKIFKIFSQPNHLSKKDKLIILGSETVTGIALDNLINLITILSVELILSTRKAKENQHKNTLLVNGNQTQWTQLNMPLNEHPVITKEKFSKSMNPVRKVPKNPINLPPSPVSKPASQPKNLTLSFDLNGRLIRKNDVDTKTLLNEYLHHGSLSNINFMNKNSPTHSIPIRYSHDNKYLESANSFYSYNDDRSSINDRFRDKILKSRSDFNKNFPSKEKRNQGLINSRKLNSQELYQLKLHQDRVKNKAKGDSLSFREHLPPKPSSSLLGGSFQSSSKLILNNSLFDQNKPNLPSDMTNRKSYRFSAQIKSKIDFESLDKVFSLKEFLYKNCNKTLFFMRRKNDVNKSKLSLTNKSNHEYWYLHIESPTPEVLKYSISIVAKRFPEWNLEQTLDKKL